jgi:hypothetical protein
MREVRTEISADKWKAEVVREVSPEEKVIRRAMGARRTKSEARSH